MATKDSVFGKEARQRAETGPGEGRGRLDVPALMLKSIDRDNRQIRVLASSAALDRHGERILPEAFKASLPVFMQNPVCLAAHAHRLGDGASPVVGRVVKIWIDKAGLWAVIQFAETELGEQYWQLYRDGFMRSVSVGFIPRASEDRDENGRRVTVYTEVELLEISCVAVPSNPEALVKADGFVDRKKREKEEGKLLEEVLAELGWSEDELDAHCEEFAELLLCGDFGDGEVADGEQLGLAEIAAGRGDRSGGGESEIVDNAQLDFAAIVRAGTRSVPSVAGSSYCNRTANVFGEDAGCSDSGGAGSARSPFFDW